MAAAKSGYWHRCGKDGLRLNNGSGSSQDSFRIRSEGRMAQVFNQILDVDGEMQQAPDFWDVSRDVFPDRKGFSTDVMLVQALLVAYFMSPAGVRPDLKAQGMQIVTAFSARTGKRFDDGFYGDST